MSPQDAYRDLDLQALELLPAQASAALRLVRSQPPLSPKLGWHFMGLSTLGGICQLSGSSMATDNPNQQGWLNQFLGRSQPVGCKLDYGASESSEVY